MKIISILQNTLMLNKKMYNLVDEYRKKFTPPNFTPPDDAKFGDVKPLNRPQPQTFTPLELIDGFNPTIAYEFLDELNSIMGRIDTISIDTEIEFSVSNLYQYEVQII